MDPATMVAAAGMGMQAYSFFAGNDAAQEQAAAKQKAIDAQQHQEAIRMKAMELDAIRKKREIIRTGQMAHAQALVTATSQGAATAGSSGIQGAFGGIEGRTKTNIAGIDQNLAFGREMFGAKQEEFQALRQAAAAGADAQSAAGIGSLGGSLVSNQKNIGQMFSYVGE